MTINSTTKTISIIVPVYKVEKYINRCIKSVLNQTMSNYELILVDDGSPDNCGKICDEWAKKDSRIRVIHKNNGGLSSARNAGLDIASGDYVTFIDSDDVIHPDYLKCLLDLCLKYNAQIAVGKIVRFRTFEMPIISKIVECECKVGTGKEVMAFTLEDWHIGANYISSCGKLYKSEILAGIRFPEGRLFEDEYITYKLYDRANRIVETRLELYFYYENCNGITANLDLLKFTDEFNAQWERMCYFEEKNYYDLFACAVKRYLQTAKWNMSQSLQINNPPEKIRRFQSRFRQVLDIAVEYQLVDFLQDYDFFVLAYPERKDYYRIKRFIKKGLKKWRTSEK